MHNPNSFFLYLNKTNDKKMKETIKKETGSNLRLNPRYIDKTINNKITHEVWQNYATLCM